MGAVFDIQAKSNRNDISKRNKKVAVRNKFNTRQASKTYTENRERERNEEIIRRIRGGKWLQRKK